MGLGGAWCGGLVLVLLLGSTGCDGGGTEPESERSTSTEPDWVEGLSEVRSALDSLEAALEETDFKAMEAAWVRAYPEAFETRVEPAAREAMPDLELTRLEYTFGLLYDAISDRSRRRIRDQFQLLRERLDAAADRLDATRPAASSAGDPRPSPAPEPPASPP